MSKFGLRDFRDRFLGNALAALGRRRKSLSHRGQLEIFNSPESDPYEWVSVAFHCGNRLVVVLELVEGGWVHLFVRSNRGPDRGKVLVRMENMAVLDNSADLVAVLEETIALVESGAAEDLESELGEIWCRVRLRAM